MIKKIIYVSCIFSILIMLFLLFFGDAKKVMVIGYHKFVSEQVKNEYFKDDIWIDSTENLKYQLKFFDIFKYKTLNLNEYECWRKGKCEIPKRSVLLTFDDGDMGFYNEVLPLLNKYNMNAVVFIIGNTIVDNDEKYEPSKKQFLTEEQIKEIKNKYKNIDIQNHSYDMHRNVEGKKRVYNMSKEEVLFDIEQMKDYKMSTFCYPGGAYSEDLMKVLEEYNYKMAFRYDGSKLSSRNDSKYLIPRVSINSGTSKMGFYKWIIKSMLYNL